MRTITIPKDVGEWSFHRYLHEIVFTQSFWRTNGVEAATAALELGQAFAGKEAGSSVQISDRSHELLLSQVGLPDAKLINPALNAVSLGAVIAIGSATPG